MSFPNFTNFYGLEMALLHPDNEKSYFSSRGKFYFIVSKDREVTSSEKFS